MSSTAVNLSVGRSLRFWQTTVGIKALMAVTGFILFGFLIGHLVGNLQIFLPPEKINHYAKLLHSAPALLWGARITLALSVVIHGWSALMLTKLQMDARPVKYHRKQNLNSSYASRTMIWGGVIIGAFVVFHLLHFTAGSTGLMPFDPENVYNNVVYGFQVVPVSIFYIITMVMVCMHLYHGIWSMFQSLGFDHPKYTPCLKLGAKLFSFAIAAGNISIPVAVMAGIIKPVVGA